VSRRPLPRYSIYLEATIEARGERSEGVTVNLSATGACVCCLGPMGAKAPVSITFYFRDARAGLLFESIAGVVKWEQKFGRLFMVGVQFQAPLNEDEHFLLLSHIELTKDVLTRQA
jgi:hypothetical protein